MVKSKNFPSIYDVAKLAGVSPSTVSRYLNRTSFVSDQKSANIERAIIEIGYRPLEKAVAHKNSRSMSIGVLIQHPNSPHNGRILEGLELSLNARGYSLVMAAGQWQSRSDAQALSYLEKSGVDGVIIVSGDIADEELISFAKDTPVVTVGYQVKGENIYPINFDNHLAAYMATLHLLQQGHTNIAHIKGIMTQPDAKARYSGYKKALIEAGITPNLQLVKQGDFNSEQGYIKTMELINSKADFSAIFAANDLMAYGAIKALHDSGYQVPEDIAVIGFDDLPMSAYFTPALTTLHQPIEELGPLCADLILQVLNNEQVEVRIPPIELVVRASTGAK